MDIYERYKSIFSDSLLFRNLSPEEISDCILHASPKVINVKKNESIVLPKNLTHLYFVLSGQFNVIQNTDMTASLVHNLIPGRCFGIAFCVENIPCSHSLQAASSGELLRLSYHGLLTPRETQTRLLENQLSITSQHLRVLAEKISHTQSRSVRVKLCAYLRDQMQEQRTNPFTLTLSRNDLAGYLNLSYPAMLRELSQMQKEGLLTVNRNRVTILNLDALLEQGAKF